MTPEDMVECKAIAAQVSMGVVAVSHRALKALIAAAEERDRLDAIADDLQSLCDNQAIRLGATEARIVELEAALRAITPHHRGGHSENVLSDSQVTSVQEDTKYCRDCHWFESDEKVDPCRPCLNDPGVDNWRPKTPAPVCKTEDRT